MWKPGGPTVLESGLLPFSDNPKEWRKDFMLWAFQARELVNDLQEPYPNENTEGPVSSTLLRRLLHWYFHHSPSAYRFEKDIDNWLVLPAMEKPCPPVDEWPDIDRLLHGCVTVMDQAGEIGQSHD